jgi:hypothetical protein
MMALAIVSSVVALGAFVWTGFRVRPRPRAGPSGSIDAATVRLPADLPPPVRRFYRAIGAEGPDVARVRTLALWGRAWMRRRPLPWLPVTFWSEHNVGWSGLQRLAVTWFGRPVLRGFDQYVDGRGAMTIGGRRTVGHEIDQGENLFLWAEVVLLPSVLATRPGVRWEPIDDHCARLQVPFGDDSDELIIHFDPQTDLLTRCRALRYREVGGPKLGWRIDYERWRPFDAGRFPARITVAWEDQATPWFVVDVDGVATNVAVSPGLTTADRPASTRPGGGAAPRTGPS